MTAVAAAGSPPARRRRAPAFLVALRERHALSTATALVVLIGVVVTLARDYHPIGDYALPELFIRQIPDKLPLVGPYSLDRGFSHPSPLFFYLAAIPYVLSGERSSSVLATAVLLNGAALTGAVWIAERRRAPGLGVALVGAVALTGFGHDPWFLVLAWNPYLAAIPFITLIVATWSIATGGTRWLVVWIVALGCWCVGCHLGFGAPVLGVWLVAAVGFGMRIRRDRTPFRILREPLLLATGVLVVMWLPTFVDLVQGGTGSNAAGIVRFVTDPPTGRVPMHDALSLLTSELSLHPYWAGGARPTPALGMAGSTAWPLLLVPIALALAFAVRRRARVEIAGVVVALAALLAGFAGAALTHAPELLSWYTLPAEMAGITVAAFTVWSLARALAFAVPAARRSQVVGTVTGVAAVVALGAVAVRFVRVEPPTLQSEVGNGMAASIPDVLRAVPPDRPIVVASSLGGREAQVGTVLELARAGRTVTVPPAEEDQLGSWWARPAPGNATSLYLSARTAPPTGPARLVATTRRIPFLLGTVARLGFWRVWPVGEPPPGGTSG